MSMSAFVSVCVSGYLSAGEHISGTTRPIFEQCSRNVIYDCGSILLWRRCNMLCTSGLMDDVMFARNYKE